MLCRNETLWSNLKPRDHRTGHAAPTWQPEQERIPKTSECYLTIFVFWVTPRIMVQRDQHCGQKYCFHLQCIPLFLHCSPDGSNTLLQNFCSSISTFLKWCSPVHDGSSRWKERLIHYCTKWKFKRFIILSWS